MFIMYKVLSNVSQISQKCKKKKPWKLELIKHGTIIFCLLASPIRHFEGNYSIIHLHKAAPTIVSASYWDLGKCFVF